MADNKLLFQNMLSEIERAVFFGDKLQSRQLLTLANPGQFIAPDLDESNDADLVDQSAIADTVLDPTCVYSPRATPTLSQKYWDIINFALLPQKTLTSKEEQEIKDIGKWMAKQEPQYRSYEEAYYQAADAYETALAAGASQAKLAMLRNRQSLALANWNNPKLGARLDWDKKNGRLTFLNSRDPNVFWNTLRDMEHDPMFERTAPDGSVFYPAYFIPKVMEINTTDRWARIGISATDSQSHSRTSSTSWSGGASLNWGLWSIGGSGGGHDVSTHAWSEASTVDVSFDALRVRIRRPWLREIVFNLQSWQWDTKVHANEPLSDGGNFGTTPPTPPVGTMPILTTELLVVRNVEIRANWSAADESYHETIQQGGGSVGWGPFRISGRYEHRSTQHDVRGESKAGVVTIAHPQVLGYFSSVLPACPNPADYLNWPKQAPGSPFHDAMYATLMADAMARREAEYAIEREQDDAAALIDAYSKLMRPDSVEVARRYEMARAAANARLRSEVESG